MHINSSGYLLLKPKVKITKFSSSNTINRLSSNQFPFLFQLREPYVPFVSKVLRVLTSYTVVLTMVTFYLSYILFSLICKYERLYKDYENVYLFV